MFILYTDCVFKCETFLAFRIWLNLCKYGNLSAKALILLDLFSQFAQPFNLVVVVIFLFNILTVILKLLPRPLKLMILVPVFFLFSISEKHIKLKVRRRYNHVTGTQIAKNIIIELFVHFFIDVFDHLNQCYELDIFFF
jgi:hypothetical protein